MAGCLERRGRKAGSPGVSLGALFSLAVVAVTVFFLGIWAIFEYLTAGERMRSGLRSELELSVDRLASSLALDLWDVNYRQADDIALSAMGDRNVLFIEVIPEVRGHAPRVFARDADWKAVKADFAVPEPGGIVASRAIEAKGKPVGSVRVAMTARFLEADLRATMARLMAAVGVLAGFMIAALYSLLWVLVLKPLRALGAYAAEVSGGGRSDLPSLRPARELSTVLEAIVRMVGLLENRYREAQASERRFRVLFDHAPDAILELDGGTGLILGANAKAERLLGRDAIEGKAPIASFFVERADAERLERGLAAASRDESDSFEAKLRKAEGGETLCSASLSPLPAAGGRRTLRLSLLDIGEKRDLEERLRHAERLDAIGQLAGGVAHDFNNQLGGIMGYAELLAERLPEGSEREWALAIMKSADRASGLTRQLLAYARRGKFSLQPVDAHALCRETAGLLERSIDKRIRIDLDLGAPGCAVRGDPSQLQNALLNLAINARDAMPEGGTLTFSTRVEELRGSEAAKGRLAEGRYLEIAVSDTGTGMDEETKKHLFEPFFTTKGPGKGTGLGLAAVWGTAVNHRGTVRARSVLGEGTRMALLLPLGGVDESMGPVPESAPAPQAGQGTIIIIDDEEAIREIACRMLEDLGYRPVAFAEPASGIEAFAAAVGEAALVILDMIMPGASGREIFASLRAIDPGARVLVCSGYALDGDARDLMAAGAVGFLQKPFTKAELQAALSRALGRP